MHMGQLWVLQQAVMDWYGIQQCLMDQRLIESQTGNLWGLQMACGLGFAHPWPTPIHTDLSQVSDKRIFLLHQDFPRIETELSACRARTHNFVFFWSHATNMAITPWKFYIWSSNRVFQQAHPHQRRSAGLATINLLIQNHMLATFVQIFNTLTLWQSCSHSICDNVLFWRLFITMFSLGIK